MGPDKIALKTEMVAAADGVERPVIALTPKEG